MSVLSKSLTLGGLLGLFIVYAGIRPSMADDTFITLQYARNLVEHGVLTWHVNLPLVDGYTSLAHALLLSLGLALGADPIAWNTWLNVLLMAVILAGLIFRTRDLPLMPRLLASLLLVLNTGFAMWFGAGLDAILYAMAVFLAYLAYEQADKTGRFGWAVCAALIFLGTVRPEGTIISFGLIAFFVLRTFFGRRGARPINWLGLGIAAAGLVGILMWREAVYGHIFPNTFYAKSAPSRLAEIGAGLGYFRDWLVEAGGLLVLLVVPFSLACGNWLRCLFVLGLIALPVVAGGDPHPAFRFFLPIFPLVAIDFAEQLSRNYWRVRATVSICLLAFLPVQFVPILGDMSLRDGVALSVDRIAEGRWPYLHYTDDPVVAERADAAQEIAAALKPGVELAANDVGALAYFSQIPILDILGLNHAVVAHLPKPLDGANKWGVPQLGYLLDQGADAVMLRFPEYDPWKWSEAVTGEMGCRGRLPILTELMSTAPQRLEQDFLCVSFESQRRSGRYLNILVRERELPNTIHESQAADALRCVAAVRAICGY